MLRDERARTEVEVVSGAQLEATFKRAHGSFAA
jgi:hypothetical protein